MTALPTIVVTGGGGQIGGRLRVALAPLGRVVAPTRAELDLGDEGAIRALLRRLRPDVVVNAAAYTAVDRAEEERDRAFRINADAPRVLAEEVQRQRGLLVHYSTDYVFDGTKREPYVESDPTAPLSVYGASKRAGEEAVEAVGGRYLVLRTTWIYDGRGQNFLRTMLRLAREREELRVVSDQIGAPTWARAVAEATARVVARCGPDGGGDGLAESSSGIYHLSASGETSWHAFARAILAADPRREEQRCRSVVPIPTREYPTPARRPLYSVLSNERIAGTFGVRLPDWRVQLGEVMEELRAGGPA